jgi:hypothetical protein
MFNRDANSYYEVTFYFGKRKPEDGDQSCPRKAVCYFQYMQWTKSIKLITSNVLYHRQVLVEQYYLFIFETYKILHCLLS